MIRAEHFVKVLAKNNIISKELAEGLLERISQAPEPIEAKLFAERLIERSVISRAIAENVLRQLEKTLASRAGTQAAAPQGPKLPQPPHAPTLPEAAFAQELGPANELSVDELPIPAAFSKKKGKFKTGGSGNLFDSKLVLFGGGGILLLLLLGTVLYFAIYRRGAEEYLNAANAARDSGQYYEAIKEYEDYLKHFPTHSGVSTATIRLSLSKMRMIVDQKSDWSEALKVAKEEIALITREPEYRNEAQPEFTAILPTIAENLAEKAKTDKDEKLLAESEEAMELIRKHVPASSQPQERLHKIQINIDFTHREIAKDARLREILAEVQTALSGANISGAFELTATLQTEYPGIQGDSRFLEILRLISLEEKNALRYVQEPFQTQRGDDENSTENSKENNVVILLSRKAEQTPTTKNVRTIFAYAAGAVFALRSTDGAVLWKKNIGGSQFTGGSQARIVPLPLEGNTEDALLVDYRTWELVRLDAQSGEIRFRCNIGEPFHLAEFANNLPLHRLYLSTKTGKLISVDVKTGAATGFLQCPQQLETAPRIDPERKLLFQIAHRTTMYVLPLEFEKTESAASLYLGHLPGTIRTSPFFFGPYLLVAKQESPEQSRLSAYAVDAILETSNTNDAQTDTGEPFAALVSIPLRGVIDTAPAMEANRLFLAGNLGNVYLFQLETDPAAKVPIRQLAEGVRDDARKNAEQQETLIGQSRYLGLFGQNLWVAGGELTPYNIRQSRSQLLPQSAIDALTTTLAPLQQIEEMFVRTFQYRGQECVVVKAFSVSEGTALWETRLADPIVAEPVYETNTKSARVVTQTGKLFRVPLPLDSEGVQVLSEPAADLFGESRGQGIRAIIPLPGGFEAWVETDLARMTSIPIYDANPDNPRQFRFIPLTEKVSAEPIALGTGLLMPMENGQIVYLDPRSNRALADPFLVKLAPNARSRWTAPALVGDPEKASEPEFVVLDQETSTLYHVRAVNGTGGKTTLTEIGSIGDMPPRADVVAELQGVALAIDMKQGLVQEVTLSDMRPGSTHEFGAALLWGPHRLGDMLVLATSKKELAILTKDSENRIQIAEYPMPHFPIQGRPVMKNGRISLSSLDGALWSIDSEQGETRTELETGVPLQTGPLFFENQTLLPGKDGCLYFR